MSDESTRYDVTDCELLELPIYSDERGKLTYVEQEKHIPFELKRVYYLYEVPGDKSRGNHAHRALRQVLVPVNGSLNVVVDDGETAEEYHLDSPNRGLYIAPMLWRELKDFSPDAVCLSLASDYYDEDDYIHDYDTFQTIRARGESSGK